MSEQGSHPKPPPSHGPEPGGSDLPPSDSIDQDDPAEEQASRALLSGLGAVAPPSDLGDTVPELIHRRSRGRFFGRKRLADRLPLEWISLAMLVTLAITYVLLKLLFVD